MARLSLMNQYGYNVGTLLGIPAFWESMVRLVGSWRNHSDKIEENNEGRLDGISSKLVPTFLGLL